MQYAVLLGLALFFGFAFEEFYNDGHPNRPGGIRTFPLLAFLGAALYLIEPHFSLGFIAGLIVIGAWLAIFLRTAATSTQRRSDGYFVVPASVLIAYALGPIALTQPLWLSVAFVVVSVLLIGSRDALHALVTRVPASEALIAGQFLLLVGVVLPLLYRAPQIPYVNVAPFRVWLAVVAVSALSYASYLLQRYAFPRSGVVIGAILGGLYSSTATTVALARRAQGGTFTSQMTAGIVAATAMMYVRILVVCAIFNAELAGRLAIPLLVLAAISLGLARLLYRPADVQPEQTVDSKNPLALGTALIFAVLLVGISLLSSWVQTHLGSAGILWLAGVVGLTDIDPFVLSIAQGGAHVSIALGSIAILIASSSNDVLKAIYTVAFSRNRGARVPAGSLLGMSLLGLLIAWMMPR